MWESVCVDLRFHRAGIVTVIVRRKPENMGKCHAWCPAEGKLSGLSGIRWVPYDPWRFLSYDDRSAPLPREGREANQPPFHVVLYIQEIFEANSPGLARSGLKHEPPKFRMEDWEWVGVSVFRSIPCNSQQIIFLTLPQAGGLGHNPLGCTGSHLLPTIPGYQPAVKRASPSGTFPPKPPRGIQPAICMSIGVVKRHGPVVLVSPSQDIALFAPGPPPYREKLLPG